MTTAEDESTNHESPPASAAGPHRAAVPVESVDAMTAFAELGRIDLADDDLPAVLGKVAELARAAIPAAIAVGVTLVQAGVAGTAAYTGDIALGLDERQYDAGFGPCLDAAANHGVNLIPDTTSDDRWPAFAAAALGVGVRSTLSVGIPIRDSVTGALNIYAREPHGFDDDAVTLARTFASHAAVAIANAHLYETTAALAAQMSEAMRTRAVIEQAKGILIAQQHVSPGVAFNMLSQASQTANRKLRDIAQAIVDREHDDS